MTELIEGGQDNKIIDLLITTEKEEEEPEITIEEMITTMIIIEVEVEEVHANNRLKFYSLVIWVMKLKKVQLSNSLKAMEKLSMLELHTAVTELLKDLDMLNLNILKTLKKH